MGATGVKRTRKSPQQRRQEMLEGAMAITNRDGLASVTLSRVASELGVTPGLVTHYFSTADQLAAATFTAAAEADLVEVFAVVESTPPGQRVRVLIDTVLDVSTIEAKALWLDAWTLGRWNRLIAEELRRFDIEWRRGATSAIEADAGVCRLRVTDAAAAGTRLMTMLDGLVGQCVARSVPLEEVRHIARSYAVAEFGAGFLES
ncbi:TetR/AcrR family transcriptional regulator [Mycolicibacterium nivoides]|uniref:TetR/AcrR family transcriptional regulator n=1 Tax=Mycolicibacterium nivoides TaxID=2487344 RepID=A0ABW9LKH6_9MYCO